MSGTDIEEAATPISGQGRAIAITLVALVLVFGGVFAWRTLRASPPPMPPREATAVAATRVVARDLPTSIEAVATLAAVREVMLSAEVAGRVSAVHFEAGARVPKGRLLVQLFDGPEQASRRSAQSRARLAASQLTRTQDLVEAGAESRELLQQRAAEREQAVAAIGEIDARLVQKQVRAPFAGVLGIRQVNPGQYLNPGDAVATLTALDRIYVNFTVPQQDLSRLSVGAPVSVASDAWPGRVFAARVNAIEPVIDAETRNVHVQAIAANPDGALRPGMYATASLGLPPEKGVLVVPSTAILTSAQGQSVVVIRGKSPAKEGKAEFVPVRTGRRIGNAVVVTEGLKDGDVVLAEGQVRALPGGPVKVTRIVKPDLD